MEDKGTKAPRRPDYVYLSEYPPGTDIEYELTWDGHRFVGKVPRWAHEKWLLKHQNEGTEALKRAWKEDSLEIPSHTSAATYGETRPREDDPNSGFFDPAVSEARIHKWKDSVKIPSETVAAYAEVMALHPELADVYPDVYAYHCDPNRYAFMQEGRRIVYKLDKWSVPLYLGAKAAAADS